MLKKTVLLVAAVLLLPFILVNLPLPVSRPEIPATVLTEVGEGDQSLLLIQPWLVPADYLDSEQLYLKLKDYLLQADNQGWLHPETLVVLPEHIGTWLVVEGESALVSHMPSTTTGMVWVVLRHLPEFLRALAEQQAPDPVASAVFSLKAENSARAYHSIFSRLAEEFNVNIFAGSIALPQPSVSAGKLLVEAGPIYNVASLFTPAGMAPVLNGKQYPISSEQGFTAAAETMVAFEALTHKVGVLICADSWYSDTYAQLSDVDVMLVPSYATVDFAVPWQGYDGFSNPADVDSGDIRTLTEGLAWQKYALAGRITQTGASAGANLFLKGRLWGMVGYGTPTLYSANAGTTVLPDLDAPEIIHFRWAKEG